MKQKLILIFVDAADNSGGGGGGSYVSETRVRKSVAYRALRLASIAFLATRILREMTADLRSTLYC